jgi:HlyD family secretion protein
VRNQIAAADAQVSQADERIRKSQVTSPIAGTVLTTYARAGEVVQIGQPLFKMASLDAVDVRAYVTEPQLATIRLGQEARVTVDAGHDQRQTLAGTINWISSQAEFTPTNIQTREERADLVYAIKIHVANENGALKIGMPADVQFVAPSAQR